MKKLNSLVLILVVLAAASLVMSAAISKPAASQKVYELKYQMSVGTKFVMKSTGASNVETDQMGNIVTTDITGGGEDKFTVLAASPETGLTLEYEFGERDQLMESSVVGSASTDFSELVGMKVKFLLSKTGDVDGYEGFDKLPAITTSTEDTLDEASYKLGAKSLWFALPEKPVKIGDTWTDEQTEDIPVQDSVLTSESTTTYKVVEEVQKDGYDCLKIEHNGVTRLSGEFEQQGTPLTMERETTSKGVFYFAYKLGMFIYSEGDANGEGIITVESMGIEIPQTITSKGTVTVLFEK
ncbi:DUF6263 family protein [Acidobacteriota bacterium]